MKGLCDQAATTWCGRDCRRLRLLELATAELAGAQGDPDAERRRVLGLYRQYCQARLATEDSCYACRQGRAREQHALHTRSSFARPLHGKLPPSSSSSSSSSGLPRPAGSRARPSSASTAAGLSTPSASPPPPSVPPSCRAAPGHAPAAARSSGWGRHERGRRARAVTVLSRAWA